MTKREPTPYTLEEEQALDFLGESINEAIAEVEPTLTKRLVIRKLKQITDAYRKDEL